MDLNQIYSELKSKFPSLEIYQNHPLAPYTTVKIGGPADIFIHTKNTKDFKNLLNFISTLISTGVLPYAPTIIGNGSNVLISDSGIRGIVIKNDSDEIEILPNNKVKISSGTQISFAINYLADNKLSGLEEFSYIPSTIGGAVRGNIHGFNKTNFSSLLESIEVFDIQKSTIINLKTDQIKWDYDYSSLQDQPNLIIISAVLNLKTGETEIIKKTAKDIYEIKSTGQLMNSLGSVFKNIEGKDPTGMIIDQQLNLKGYSIGDAQISPLHANFIVNNGQATATDYFNLIQLIQSKAKEKLNLDFELEIKLLGEF
jgi:UDP-N-acetylmuramate dehydrogenase